MPTFERPASFLKAYLELDPSDQVRFKKALEQFVSDLGGGSGTFHPSLRVKGVQGAPGVFEMTWAKDGRATFQYGPELQPGEPHVFWRRLGTHDIFSRP